MTKSKEVIKEIDFCGQKLIIKSGKIATQAESSVITQINGTVVLTTLFLEEKMRNWDSPSLTVTYREMSFAAGKIPGGFIKRENKINEQEILISNLIDRAIKPVLPENFPYIVQISCTVLSYDKDFNPDILAIIGASIVLHLSKISTEVIGAIKLAKTSEFILNPTHDLQDKKLELFVAATSSSIKMLELGASEILEHEILEAIKIAQEPLNVLIKEIKNFGKGLARKKLRPQDSNEINEVYELVKKELSHKIKKILTQPTSLEEKIHGLEEEFLTNHNIEKNIFKKALEKLRKELLQKEIITQNIRPDKRKLNELKKTTYETTLLPSTHGSSLLTKEKSQALVVVTLGSTSDEQVIETLQGDYRENFIIHYVLSPYLDSIHIKNPSKLEIISANFGYKAMSCLIPPKKDFTYTIRTVAEITEFDDMYSVSAIAGSSLALMDAGVPLKTHIAGINIGVIIKNKKQYLILSDISSQEYCLQDISLKVAGTKNGITALQLDVNNNQINEKILSSALKQAKLGLEEILKDLNTCIKVPKKTLHKNVPILKKITIDKTKIRELIGPGGKNIKEISEKFNIKIEVSDNGEVQILGRNLESLDKAISYIIQITKDIKIGQSFIGKVSKITDIGVIIISEEIKEIFVHLSEISIENIKKIEDHIQVGQEVRAHVISLDQGKPKFSLINRTQKVTMIQNNYSSTGVKKENKKNIETREVIEIKHFL